MDVGGSFLELSCVRIAVIPTGPPIPDHRFDELSAHLTAFRQVPVNALPRRAPVSRPTSTSSFNSTYSSMTPTIRDALSDPASRHLARSHSSSLRATSQTSRPSAYSLLQSPFNPTSNSSQSQTGDNSSPNPPSATQALIVSLPQPGTKPASPRFHSELDLTGPDVDSSFRLRYEIIHRDHTGALLMRPSSEWDDFHSTKVWGVFGIVDCTSAMDEETGTVNSQRREQMISEAAHDFRTILSHFKQSAVRRLIVFTHSDDHHQNPFVLNDIPSSSNKDSPSSNMGFGIGHIPEHEKSEDTRLEARAQVTHFAGLVLNEIDAECWRRRESPTSELFLSPIDEHLTTDRQSKLAKRRAGRLDKLLGDSLLLMGSPGEALIKYTSAMERSKASSDRLWLAGAMEGWAAAHVLAHVGGGGSANDKTLTNKLIEHYAEIYKMYQKKRVVEPEVVAAMRLAEFLGRWTNRRREALDAAQHAATVGEGLRSMKRAVLWEALARFSDRMGCRRKAALYLYRLGQHHIDSVPSSAVTLMVAAERQLCKKSGAKPWSSLNRRVLLIAAKHAESTGDVGCAARLYVDALVTSPSGHDPVGNTDQGILKTLGRLQIPSHLPAAVDVLQLDDIAACQMYGLSIRRKNDEDAQVKSEIDLSSKEGPFIYNPFEAKKRAKAAADAKRSVTWVCDEEAYVSLRLINNIGAELVVDVIAVLFSDSSSSSDTSSTDGSVDEGKDQNNKYTAATDVDKSLKEDSSVDFPMAEDYASIAGGIINIDEEGQSAEHTALVREMLDKSATLARTLPESVTVYPYDRSGTTKYITVTPRKTGPLFIDGVLVRIFNGALVVLRSNSNDTEQEKRHHKQTNRDQRADKPNSSDDPPPIDVMPKLPKMHVSARYSDGEYEGRHGVVIYDGERRFVWIEVRNCGTEKVAWMKSVVSPPDDATYRITSDEMSGERHEMDALESPGGVRKFRVEILGVWDHQNDAVDSRQDDLRLYLADDSFVSHISVHIEYEGVSEPGTIRESSTQIRVVCRRAVSVGRLVMFDRSHATNASSIFAASSVTSSPIGSGSGENVMEEGTSGSEVDSYRRGSQCLSVEVRNFVSVPSRVSVLQRDENNSSAASSGSKTRSKSKSRSKSKNKISTLNPSDIICTGESMIEHGACALLVCDLSHDFETRLRTSIFNLYRKGVHGSDGSLETSPLKLFVRWILPAMGREGIVNVDLARIKRAAMAAWDVKSAFIGYGTRLRSIGLHANIQISLVKSSSTQGDGEDMDVIKIGSYATIRVTIRNAWTVALPPGTSLDLEIGQSNDSKSLNSSSGFGMRGIYLVGITKGVHVGPLPAHLGEDITDIHDAAEYLDDKSFSHEVKVRVNSAGCFELSASLYDQDDENDDDDDVIVGKSDSKESGEFEKHAHDADAINDDNVDIIYPQTIDSKRLVPSKRRRSRLIACSVYRFFGVRNN